MATVYVKWYGKVLEGEMLDGDYLGMKQVVIPLDGHHPIAMFTPGHVYDSIEQIAEKSSINFQKAAENFKNPQEISSKQQILAKSDVMPADDREMIKTFKRENWDTERNHLRIDKLDEFYQIWRMVMKPAGFVEAEAPVTLPSHKEAPVSAEAPKRIVSDERMEELKQQLKTALAPKPAPQPTPKPETPKPSKKMLRSTGIQQFNDGTQLALFE